MNVKRAWEELVSLLFLSLAVIFLPFSVTLCHVALILFLIISLIQRKILQNLRAIRGNFLLLLLTSLLIVHLAGMFYTENVNNGWLQLEKKVFLFLLPIALTVSIRIQKKDAIFIFLLFISSCFLASVICLVNSFYQTSLLADGSITLSDFNYLSTTPYQILNPGESGNWMLFSYRSLADGVSMHPTYLSLYFAFCIIILVHFFDIKLIHNTTRKNVSLALIIYFSTFIIFLSSRIIIISLLGILIFTITRGNNVSAWLKFVYSFLVIAGLTILIYANPVSRYRCYQEFFVSKLEIEPNKLYANSTEIRASLWWLGLKSMQETNWLWGSGTGDSQDVMRKMSDNYNVKNTIGSDNPHNQFICTIIQHGVLGAFILMSLLTIPIATSLLRKDYIVFGFCSLFMLTCLTETVLELQKGIDFFAIFYPLLLFQNSHDDFPFQVTRR